MDQGDCAGTVFSVGDVQNGHLWRDWSSDAFLVQRETAVSPLIGLMFDIEPSRLDEMISAGIETVEILGSGQYDCTACSALAGKVYPIVAPPILPPADCECVPWCRLVVTAES